MGTGKRGLGLGPETTHIPRVTGLEVPLAVGPGLAELVVPHRCGCWAALGSPCRSAHPVHRAIASLHGPGTPVHRATLASLAFVPQWGPLLYCQPQPLCSGAQGHF